MTSAADVRRQRAAVDVVARGAKAVVHAGFASLNPNRPEASRDALLKLVPATVDQFGRVAAGLGADFYERQRAAAKVPGRFRALTMDPSTGAAEGATRRLAGWLFTDDPAGALPGLDAVVDRLVKAAERETITAAADQERVRFARVPGNAEPCDFCAMLAGRGFVYTSADAAGESWDYHSNCGCQPVPSWDGGSALLSGFDPARYEAQYRDALAEDRLSLDSLATSSLQAKFDNREATNARARAAYHARRAGGNAALDAGTGYSSPQSAAAALLRGNQRFNPRTGLRGQ